MRKHQLSSSFALILILGAVVTAAAIGLMRHASEDAEAHVPHAGLDFSIAVQGVPCDSSAGPVTCNASTPFTISLRLNAIPGGFSYGGYDSEIQFSGVTPVSGSLAQQGAGVWPACYFAASYFAPGQVNASCAVNVQAPPSSYTGVLWRLGLQCDTVPGTVTVTLVNATGHTQLVDGSLTPHSESETSEMLTIQCTAPPPTPTPTATRTPTPSPTPTATATPFVDDDDDGCSNQAEQQTGIGSETSGGRRDYQNPYDYFNPTNDKLNRVDDVLATVDAYFLDDADGNPGLPPYSAGYNPDTDRVLLGPLAWNLGAPNGQQRVDDILNAVRQYFHDC